ncbi:uncharacterized protein LOC105634424 [Jatropha curcas]|uniref:uncharacterized protein LOC105634424 n=1 Tax=Jatropha curcas TaxID=180498 RepID=UPI0005FAAE6C|nr:uncharacterized protein LOC105634424 [Jatropha curcas]
MVIQTLEDMLCSRVIEFEDSWEKYVFLIEFAYNNRYQLSIQMAPFEALFGKKGKLNPRFIGPYEILERVGLLAYKLALPSELDRIHNVFHVSILRRYRSDPFCVISPETVEIHIDLSYEEEPVHILARDVKDLRNKRIVLVKVLE